jgi:hypothetical protein
LQSQKGQRWAGSRTNGQITTSPPLVNQIINLFVFVFAFAYYYIWLLLYCSMIDIQRTQRHRIPVMRHSGTQQLIDSWRVWVTCSHVDTAKASVILRFIASGLSRPSYRERPRSNITTLTKRRAARWIPSDLSAQ